MSNKLSRILSISLYLLLAISVVFALSFYLGKKVPGTEGTAFEEPRITQNMIIWAYVLVAIAAVAAIIFPLMSFIRNPKHAKNILILILVAAVLVVISYLIASSEAIPFLKVEASTSTLKLVDTGLLIVYILAAIAFLGILFYEVASLFR